MARRPPALEAAKQLVRVPFAAEQRRSLPRPTDPADYERPELDGSGPSVADIAMGGTPPGGYDEFPLAVLGGSRDPLPPVPPTCAVSGSVTRVR